MRSDVNYQYLCLKNLSHILYLLWTPHYSQNYNSMCLCHLLLYCYLANKWDLLLNIYIFVSKIYPVYWTAVISQCSFVYWISCEVHTIGKTVVSTSVICCLSVVWQSKWDLTFFINVSVYKIYLVYWITLIYHFNLAYWISGEVHTAGKTVICTCLICCFSVIMQSKWDLMLIVNIFVYKCIFSFG